MSNEEKLAKFEQLQIQLAIASMFDGNDSTIATSIFKELEALNLNPIIRKPKLRLIKGGIK